MIEENERQERIEKQERFDHNCNQGVTLAVICEKLERIEHNLAKMESKQDEYMKLVNEMAITNAKYPTPSQLDIMVRTLERHNTYFTIFGAALVSAWALLIMILSHLWGG